jgi:hypothetical protein
MSDRRTNDAGLALALAVIFLTAFVSYWLLKITVTCTTEGIRIYATYGHGQSIIARVLRRSLAAFVGLTGICAVLASALPATRSVTINVVCFAFFGFCLTVAACGWIAEHHDLEGLNDLDTYLDFSTAGRRSHAQPPKSRSTSSPASS